MTFYVVCYLFVEVLWVPSCQPQQEETCEAAVLLQLDNCTAPAWPLLLGSNASFLPERLLWADALPHFGGRGLILFFMNSAAFGCSLALPRWRCCLKKFSRGSWQILLLRKTVTPGMVNIYWTSSMNDSTINNIHNVIRLKFKERDGGRAETYMLTCGRPCTCCRSPFLLMFHCHKMWHVWGQSRESQTQQ